MEIGTIGLFGAFLLASALIGIIVVIILFLVNTDEALPIRLLSLHLVCLILLLLSNAGYETDIYLKYPFLFRIFSLSTFCITPLSYLYVRTSLTQSVRLKKTDWLLFIPAILYLLQRIHFYQLPPNIQLDYILYTLKNYRAIMEEPDSLLPPGWIAVIRMIISVTFVSLQIRLLLKWYPVIKNHESQIKNQSLVRTNNMERYKWLSVFTGIIVLSYLLVFIATILQLKTPVFYGYLIAFTVSSTVLTISVTLMLKPRLLYGMSGWLFLQPNTNPEESSPPPTAVSPVFANLDDDDKPNIITEEIRTRIESKIREYFSEKTSFLNFKFSIKDLSAEIQIPVYLLSAFINQQYNKTFIEFINDARIEKLLGQLKTDPKIHSYTLQHIGENLGFKSRTSFISAVKKRTGMTPSELMAGHPENNSSESEISQEIN